MNKAMKKKIAHQSVLSYDMWCLRTVIPYDNINQAFDLWITFLFLHLKSGHSEEHSVSAAVDQICWSIFNPIEEQHIERKIHTRF